MYDIMDFENEVKFVLIDNKRDKDICIICKKKFDRGKNQKYCSEECRIIGKKARTRIYTKKPSVKKKNNEQSVIRRRLTNSLKNPQCSFLQGGRCVKKSLEFNGFKFYPRGFHKCPIFPRDKCPSFKPTYPDIYKATIEMRKLEEKWKE